MSTELKVKMKFDGSELSRGLKKSEGELKGFASAAKLALGAFAGSQVLGSLKNLYLGFEEDAAAAKRLEDAILRVGGSMATTGAAMEKVSRASHLLGVNDTELSKAMARLVTMTGDATAAMQNMNLVLDVSAGAQIDLDQATKIVAGAMSGQTEEIGRLLPKMKLWSAENTKLKGTALAAAKGLDELWIAFGGASAERANTAIGQMTKARNTMGEIGEQAVRIAVGATDTAAAWKSVNSELDRVKRSMEIWKPPEWLKNLPVAFGFIMQSGRSLRQATGEYLNGPPGLPDSDSGGPWPKITHKYSYAPAVSGNVGGGPAAPALPALANPYSAILNAPYTPGMFGIYAADQIDLAGEIEDAWANILGTEEEMLKKREAALNSYADRTNALAGTLSNGMLIGLDAFLDKGKSVTEELARFMYLKFSETLAELAAKKLALGIIGIAGMLFGGVSGGAGVGVSGALPIASAGGSYGPSAARGSGLYARGQRW